LEKTVIAKEVSPDMPALTLADVAEVKLAGPIAKRGDASVNGKPGVLLAVSKQPGTDTIGLTERIEQELTLILKSLNRPISLKTPFIISLKPCVMVLFWWQSSCSYSC